MLGQFLQIIAALGLVIVLLIIAFYVYNTEEVKAITKGAVLKKSVPIFKGMYDLSQSNTNTLSNGYSTSDPSDPSYLDIGYSVNQRSGAEFSYSFWLYLDYDIATRDLNGKNPAFPVPPSRTAPLYTDAGLTYTAIGTGANAGQVTAYTPSENNTTNTSTANPTANPSENKYLQPVVLFVRGENVARTYKGLCFDKNSDDGNDIKGNKSKVDVLIKSPLVKLENNGDTLTVEFNTTFRPEAMIENSKNTCKNGVSKSWTEMNAYKVAVKGLRSRPELQKTFFLVTITLQDTFPSDPISIRNKIRARIFINTSLELDTYISYSAFNFNEWNSGNSLRLNNGNLYVAPIIGDAIFKDGDGNPSRKYSVLPQTKNEIIMADLTYFNYVLNPNDIEGIYKAKFNTTKIYSLNSQNLQQVTDEINMTPSNFPGGLKPSSTQFN